MNKFQAALGIFVGLLLISQFIFVIGGHESETVEEPCVDGVGRVNLEGMMCEGHNLLFYGNDWEDGNIFVISVLSMVFFIVGLLLIVGILDELIRRYF